MAPRRKIEQVGKDAYIVRNGSVLRERGAKLIALVNAQSLAVAAKVPTTLTVERRSIIGPPVELYRVVRDEDGTVVTYTVNRED